MIATCAVTQFWHWRSLSAQQDARKKFVIVKLVKTAVAHLETPKRNTLTQVNVPKSVIILLGTMTDHQNEHVEKKKTGIYNLSKKKRICFLSFLLLIFIQIKQTICHLESFRKDASFATNPRFLAQFV